MGLEEIVAVLVELLEDQEGVEIDYTIEDREQDGIWPRRVSKNR